MKMSLKKKKISRVNSVAENVCNYLQNPNCKCPAHLEITESEDVISTEKTLEQEHTESAIFQIKLSETFSRTSLLLQDYHEFKAARSIQSFVRGWLYRRRYKRKRWAAIVIQAEWRRFYGQRLFFRKLETVLQQRIEEHFFRAAQKIQAFWRGWWVRHHVHDLTHLTQLQQLAGQDLLYCVAFKLHHMLRTQQIPGVYSLRNSNALSKVEQLLASLRFKAFNQRTQQVMRQSCREKRNAEKQHLKSTFGTKIPFPQDDGLAKKKCLTISNVKDADARMAKIIKMYEEGNRKISQPQVLKTAKLASHNQHPLNISPSESSSFCGDIVESMKKWKIITKKNLNVDANIFKNPQNVENFLKEIGSKLSLVEQNPNCNSLYLKKPLKDEVTMPGNGQKLLKNSNEVQRPPLISPGCSIISSAVFTLDKDLSSLKETDIFQDSNTAGKDLN